MIELTLSKYIDCVNATSVFTYLSAIITVGTVPYGTVPTGLISYFFLNL